MKCRPPWNRWPGLAVMPSMATRQKTLTLNVFGLNCSLKSSKSRERSSTDALMQQLFGELAKQGATGKIIRAADYNIKPGVKSDEGKGDDWPGLRRQLLAADILVIGAPKLHAVSSSRRSIIDLNFGRRSSRSLEQPLVPISSSGRPQRR